MFYHVFMHICKCVQRPERNIRCISKLFSTLLYFLHLLFICVMYDRERACMYHGTHVCVKGQLTGVIYLFLPLGSQGSNSSILSMQQVP